MTHKKAFTLVELLIVIVVIGVLAGAFMYSSTEAVTTARATVILNNLHIVKDAVLSFYTDNPDLFEFGRMSSGIQNYLKSNKNAVKQIANHFKGHDINFQNMNSSNAQHMPFVDEGYYGVADAGYEEYKNVTDKTGTYIGGAASRYTWFVGYRFKSNEGRVKEKLKARAKSMGLTFAGRIPNYERLALISDDQGRDVNYSTGDDVVWLRVFGEWDKASNDWQVGA